jgi:hypothetical protein
VGLTDKPDPDNAGVGKPADKAAPFLAAFIIGEHHLEGWI